MKGNIMSHSKYRPKYHPKFGKLKRIPVKERTFCVQANRSKMKFATEGSAEQYLKYIDGEEFKKKKPIRSYHCTSCRAWHVTSKKGGGRAKSSNEGSSLAALLMETYAEEIVSAENS